MQRTDKLEPGPPDLSPDIVPLACKPNFLHRILCRLDLCSGNVEHERDLYGTWWVGIRCPTCHRLLRPIKSKYQEKKS